jgi:hypothetical protein
MQPPISESRAAQISKRFQESARAAEAGSADRAGLTKEDETVDKVKQEIRQLKSVVESRSFSDRLELYKDYKSRLEYLKKLWGGELPQEVNVSFEEYAKLTLKYKENL